MKSEEKRVPHADPHAERRRGASVMELAVLLPLLLVLFIGIIGEYVASIHTEVRRLPLVVERERINFGAVPRADPLGTPVKEVLRT